MDKKNEKEKSNKIPLRFRVSEFCEQNYQNSWTWRKGNYANIEY